MQAHTDKKNIKKEIPVINILKGIAIIFMLFGHSLQYGTGSEFLEDELYWANSIMKLIYSFHMPLFMCISGYLFSFSVEKKGVKKSVLARIFRFTPIIIVWAGILCVLDLFSDKPFMFKRFIYYVVTDFWFLWAIIVCSAGLFIIETIHQFATRIPRKYWISGVLSGGYYYWIVSLILFVAFFITPDYYGLASYKFMYPYFFGGYLYAESKAVFLKNNKFGVVMVATWCLFLTQFSEETYIYTTGITLTAKEDCFHQILINVFRYLIGGFGSCACIWLVTNIYSLLQPFHSNKLVKIIGALLTYLGKQSLTLYVLSTYIYDRFLPLMTQSFSLNYFIVLLETILIILLCLAIAKLLGMSELLSRIVIGVNGSKPLLVSLKNNKRMRKLGSVKKDGDPV